MGISVTCSEALCWQESLGYPCYKSPAVIPTFLSLSSFYHLRIHRPASLLGYPVMNSSRSTWVWPHPKTAAWSQKSGSLNWTYLCYLQIFCAGLDRQGPGACHRTLQWLKLLLLDCKCTLGATFCLPNLSCASSAARLGDTQTRLPSGMTSKETDIYWWTITACHIPSNRGTITELYTSTKHTGEHHNIMQTFQRIYGAKKNHLAFKQGTEHYRPFALLNQQIPVALVSNPASLLLWTYVYHNWPYACVQEGHATCLCNIYRNNC